MAESAVMYTHGHHESVLRSHRWRTAENSAAYLLPHLRPGMSLLDLGCGAGTITADLAAAVAPGRVIAVDFASDAVAETRRIAEERGLTNVEVIEADVYALELTDESVDVVHAHQLLQHLADPVAALREMRRVRRYGGVVAARDADYGAMAWFPDVPGLREWRSIYRRVARLNHGEPDAGRRILSWARTAGFAQVAPSASVWCYARPADRSWWGGTWAERMLDSAVSSRAVDSGVAARSDLESIAAAWRSWAAEPDGWFVVPHGEVLCRG